VWTPDDAAVAAGHSVDPACWRELFDELMFGIAGRFARVEPRRTAREFVLGLLSAAERKNCWWLAERAGHADPQAMQRLLRTAAWDAGGVRDDVRAFEPAVDAVDCRTYWVLGLRGGCDLRSLDNAPVPGARPKSFGGKCDLLALDSDGRLLAVEVKPKGVSTIVWAPAQAIVYARLHHLWTRNDPQAAEIISGMISQRQELHLLASRTPRPVPMQEVLPVVAVQRGMSQKHRERLFAVRHHLQEHGIEDAAKLQIYEVTLAGRLLNADRRPLQDVSK
jgi:hypothetical protein